jgi:hypothetical protein
MARQLQSHVTCPQLPGTLLKCWYHSLKGHPLAVPSQVSITTTGGGSVRFNPNLYNCGKVCLSLLGTWSGGQGESWDPQVSSAFQVGCPAHGSQRCRVCDVQSMQPMTDGVALTSVALHCNSHQPKASRNKAVA